MLLEKEHNACPRIRWCPPPDTSQIGSSDVHIWAWDLRPDSAVVRQLHEVLSPDEVKRSNQYRYPLHSRRFVVRRAMTRLILSRYRVGHPDNMVFAYGPRGKPRLAGRQIQSTITFSITHVDDSALLAIARGRSLGIDMENITRQIETDTIALRYFSTKEATYINSSRESDRNKAFFSCWTFKEAFVKALGCGLSFPLHGVETPLTELEDGDIVRFQNQNFGQNIWNALKFNLRPEVVATLVAEGQCWTPRWFCVSERRISTWIP